MNEFENSYITTLTIPVTKEDSISQPLSFAPLFNMFLCSCPPTTSEMAKGNQENFLDIFSIYYNITSPSATASERGRGHYRHNKSSPASRFRGHLPSRGRLVFVEFANLRNHFLSPTPTEGLLSSLISFILSIIFIFSFRYSAVDY